MFKYFQTTTLLLILCFGLSIVWSYLQYQIRYTVDRQKNKRVVSGTPLVPVLLIAPLSLVAGFRLFGINLIYPVSFDSTFVDLLMAGIVPSVVLAFASGLLPAITAGIGSELAFWNEKPFVLMMTASGLESKKMMRRLIMYRALVSAWMRCMPWLFGEMIIVEVIFNAPGLGLDAWTMAKQRNVGALLESLIWLGMLYVVCVVCTQSVQKKLGRRLESYA